LGPAYSWKAGASNNVTTWPALNCPSVTPDVFIVKKEYIGPEDETATGPNFPHKYKITLDVATGQTIGTADRQGLLPNGMVYCWKPSRIPPTPTHGSCM